ncbi:protein LNK1-like isoform X5 [Durio zibethinus]|uniref:Protein LNK1-like isoform X5 n=1 Tax=Durio zibethinus TaxID=66656 RepID=A0A6P6AFY2_DURZI|nr:protein LNK1-like isoform X5 [Durio zibethinus]
MSDLCMYELEDNVWDEFGASEDHIVPRTVDEYGAQFKVQGDGRKKPRHEVIGVTSNAYNTTKYSILGENEKGLHTLTKNRMLEKGPWSHSPDGVFPTSGDNESLNEATSMASDDPRMSNHCLTAGNIASFGSEFYANNPFLVDKCATEDNNVYRFPLNHISKDDDDLNFFNDNHEDKENSDLFYYDWGDIGNFEDVDRMFRSCDSTFGLESLSNEDDLCWFSSSQVTEGSQDALKADAKLNSVPEHRATSRPDSAGPSTIDSNKKIVLPSDKISSLNMKGDNAGLSHMSSLNVSNKDSESKDDSTPNEQISPQKKQSKQLSPSGERNDQHLENDGPFHRYGNIKQFADVKHPVSDSSCQLFSPSGLQRHKQSIGPDSVGQSEQDEGHSEVEGVSVGKPSELGSSNAQEISCVSSVLDEISLEATSFRQLQQVMEKLDIRTKLCIRDSLYRLARSAEQRHNCTNTKGGIRDDKGATGPLVAEETNKCTGFMDIETDTNPIDRSIAHLLFHRPSDPSPRPTTSTASFMSHGMIHGSIAGPTVITEKHIGHEETGTGSDK